MKKEMNYKLIGILTSLLLMACNATEMQENSLSATASNVENAEFNTENGQVSEKIQNNMLVQSSARPKQINFKYEMSQERAKVGQAFDIKIIFADFVNNQINVRLEGSKNLKVNSVNLLPIAIKSNGSSEPNVITVTPQTEGIHYLTIYKDGVESQSKPSAIKIIAGNKPESEYLEQAGEIVIKKDGSTVIEAIAEEG